MSSACLIRNTGIIAHIDAGKTTLSERILFYCDKIHRMGEVHDGAATMDYMPEEQERGITINAACTSCEWPGCRINLVDTPGHMDFTMEVERCLRVLDSAIGVFCAVGGVEPQSETVWRQADEFNLPRLAFINKMDRQGADFEGVIQEMRSKLGVTPAPVTIPCGSAETFSGIIDLPSFRKLLFDPEDQGKTVIPVELSEDEKALAQGWRKKLEESVAEADDDYLALWLENQATEQDLRDAIARATRGRKIVPVFCGSALRNIGVQPLLDGLRDYLPAPENTEKSADMASHGGKAEKGAKATGVLTALVFKIDMSGGRKACTLRIYNGELKENDVVYNLRTGKTERISKIYHIHADRREQIPEAIAGDIVLVTGLKNVRSGDTLASSPTCLPMESVQEIPQVVTFSLEPRNAEEAKILDEALARYIQEDPALSWQTDEESGLRMLSGMGELHIEVTLEKLAREYKINPRHGQPQVALRESINTSATDQALFDREYGKEHHYGEVKVMVESLPRGSGTEVNFQLENPIQESEKSRQEWQQAVSDGIRSVLQSGPLEGWPVTDARITIKNASLQNYTLPGLEMAAVQACRNALLNASPVLLEPIMRVEISVPEEFLGPSLQLLQQNGGKIDEIDDREGIKKVRASAPMRRLFGFATRLRSSTQGRAGFLLSFLCHDTP